MKLSDGAISLSATDVANHLSCHHLTTLNLFLAKGSLQEPKWENPHLRVLQHRGIEHEKAYIRHLQSKALTIADLSNESEQRASDTTINAMKAGVAVIVQAGLVHGVWKGRADVLLRVNHPSRLGDWSYEVVDCKLARNTKAETILQLCLYSELVGEIQGVDPENLHVIRPNVDFEPESYRVSSFAAYSRFVKASLSQAVTNTKSIDDTYPEPVAHCEICRWWKQCDQQRRRDDHLTFVAGASRLQRKELNLQLVPTLEALAKLPLPIPFNPSRGARESYARIREQARIQYEGRIENKPKSELLQLEPPQGFFRLPAPSAGDLFLDFEGDPYVDPGGLEYLTGIVTADQRGDLAYECRWALDRARERQSFEWLIDLAFERMSRFPDLHIYHFGAYEPSAIKRLMLRYATREEEVDELLRGGIFIDLHRIVRQALRASVEQYSLKDLEKFCGYARKIPLPEASHARHAIENQLELMPSPHLADDTRNLVERYNEDDCRATERLRAWLESLRAGVIAGGTEVPRPERQDPAPTVKVNAQQQRVAALFDALTRDLPAEPAMRTKEQAACWLLAHALDWHRREQKVQWWEYFRLRDLPEEDLYDEKAAVAGLSLRRRMPKMSPRERAPIDQYHYPFQECSIKVDDTLYTADGKTFGDVVAANSIDRTIDVKKQIKLDTFHPKSVFAHSSYGTDEQTASILRVAEWIVANGIDTHGAFRATRDLLLGRPPRLVPGASLSIGPGETAVQAACRIGLALDHSVLPIQGPPGAGKTFTGSHMICELVRQGKKVGIAAVSHKVIRKLLDDVVRAALENNTPLVCAHRKKRADPHSRPVHELGDNDEALRGLQAGTANVVGGTSWLWSREEFTDALDVLFVDEAGQMSLANVLACAPAAKSLVLLGDPQQLEQPQKGSHPEGSDVSALAHLLHERKTIEDSQGLFLAETWRLHPDICCFTSEVFYEGRLGSLLGLDRQKIEGPAAFSGAGLWFSPVQHDGNQSYSTEEVERVAAIVDSLMQPGTFWIDRSGNHCPITLDQILIVAPYNDQVNRLRERLGGGNVGTVDKFQGQEAPVVIYSMTTSAPEDAPRGMEFLYSLNRFNVATSRARCACMVVGSPRLFQPECHTPRQMELANALCRYRELSREVWQLSAAKTSMII